MVYIDKKYRKRGYVAKLLINIQEKSKEKISLKEIFLDKKIYWFL